MRLLLSLLLFVFLGVDLRAQNQTPPPSEKKVEASSAEELLAEIGGQRKGHEAFFYNTRIRTFEKDFLGVPPEHRAEVLAQNIERILGYGGAFSLGTRETTTGIVIELNGESLTLILPQDAEPGLTMEQTAERVRARLHTAVKAWYDQKNPTILLIAFAKSFAYFIALVVIFFALVRFKRIMLPRIKKSLSMSLRKTNIGKLGKAGTGVIEIAVVRVIDFAIVAILGVMLVLIIQQILGAFPYTRPYAHTLADTILGAASAIGLSFLQAIPDLLIMGLIIFFATALVRVGNNIIDRLVDLEQAWLDDDTVVPTKRLFSVAIWLFAIVTAYPYLPGADSDAFKGISVLLGLMVSLGASSIVGQAASGMILLYSKILRPGEWIEVAGVEGRVVKIGVFATVVELRTKELVNVPNVSILSNQVTNYSRSEEGMVASTEITIGYDTPWRQVEALLHRAVDDLEGVSQEIKPWVLQTKLNDFYVHYKTHVIILDPVSRLRVLNRMHAAIQDEFNRCGVQIMSPHFRDRQKEQALLSPPSEWYADPAAKPQEG